MAAFYIIKPTTGSTVTPLINVSLYINSWAVRDTTQIIMANPNVYRVLRITSSAAPTDYRIISLADYPIRYFKGEKFTTLNASNYSGAVEEVLNSSAWTEITYEEFATANNVSVTKQETGESLSSYTTSDERSYLAMFPASRDNWFVSTKTLYNVTFNLSNCSCDVASGRYPDGTELTATITPDADYELTTAPSITGSSGTWTKTGDNWECTFTVTEDTVVTATATPKAVYYPVTYDLVNCTCDVSSQSILSGTELTVTFTPASGYELFTNPPTLTIGSTVVSCTTQSDPSLLTVSGIITVTGPLTISGTGTVAPATIPVTDNTVNAIVSPSSDTVPFNVPVTFTVTAATHYSFSEAPTINGVAMEQGTGGYTVTVYPRAAIVIAGTANEDPYITAVYALSGCTVTPPDTTKYYEGDVINLTLTADTGLYFQNVPYVTITNRYSSQVKVDCTPLDTSEYPAVFQFIHDTGAEPLKALTVHAVCQAIPLIEDFGVFNIYAPTLENLTSIANMRYSFSESAQYYYKDVDLGQFVLSLMKVYVPITTSVSAEIVLGGYQTGVSCPTITYPYTTVECGTVEIEEYYNDITDYSQTTLRLFLPFYGFVNIDPVSYMGKEVSITYDVELLTGKALITLKADDNIIETFTCKVAMDIPYLLTLDKTVTSKYEFNEYLLMDKTPYIEQWVNIEDTTAKIRGNKDNYSMVGNNTGYQRFDIIFNNLPISKEEKDEITALCRNGVFL